MQFLVSVLNDRREFGTSDEQAAIEVFNDQLQSDGHWAASPARGESVREHQQELMRGRRAIGS